VITATLFQLLGVVVGALVCTGVVALGLTWLSSLDEFVARPNHDLTGLVYEALNYGGYLFVCLGAAGLLGVARRLAVWL